MLSQGTLYKKRLFQHDHTYISIDSSFQTMESTTIEYLDRLKSCIFIERNPADCLESLACSIHISWTSTKRQQRHTPENNFYANVKHTFNITFLKIVLIKYSNLPQSDNKSRILDGGVLAQLIPLLVPFS